MLAVAIDHPPPTTVDELLHYQGSTTALFKTLCPHEFQVQLLQVSWRQPTTIEMQNFSFTDQKVFEREVLLQCGEKNLMYARVLFPQKTIENKYGKVFTELGTQPLGEILYQDPNLSRSEFYFQKVYPTDVIYQQMTQYFTASSDNLWARQSIYYFHHSPIFLYEIFLPDLIKQYE